MINQNKFHCVIGRTASTLAAARPVTLTVHGLILLVPQAKRPQHWPLLALSP
ncbi:hypothetical protein J6590_062672 [Homalodisca vitripennis]|nr:hypothetical protein J6590_062672 [Homalodisca vitripennis]